MDFIKEELRESSPYRQLLMLAGYAVAGMVATSVIAIGIVAGIYGLDSISSGIAFNGQDVKYRPALQILMIATSLGVFFGPALFLPLTEGKKIKDFYSFKPINLKLLVLVLVIMGAGLPIIEWTGLINQKMVLPDFLKPVQNWMKMKEDEAMVTTLILLKMNGVKDFLINIFMIALVPAVAEELMFRGGIQRSFNRMFKNPHAAIWVSAFIFSAIHVQFYGFLPRFLLGAGFGYLYLWSGSLWYAMFGHFLNNGYAVCAAWYMQKNNIPLSETDQTMTFTWYGYLISFVVAVVAFQYFKKQTAYQAEK